MENRVFKRRGIIFILSSPSGAGKTSLAKVLLEQDHKIVSSISITTRPPRAMEKEGEAYFFTDSDTFHQHIKAGVFLEHAILQESPWL